MKRGMANVNCETQNTLCEKVQSVFVLQQVVETWAAVTIEIYKFKLNFLHNKHLHKTEIFQNITTAGSTECSLKSRFGFQHFITEVLVPL
jgi:nicotinamidase-related amidase